MLGSEERPSFVSSPYIECPECGASRFGRLWVRPRSYVRKCEECGFYGTFDLPDIKKTLIYLDQFAISGIMKALNPRDPGHEQARSDGWLDLFTRLDRLAQLQLVVCPESPAHEVESLLYQPGSAELRRMYEHLSRGARFHDPEQILGRQVYVHAMDWVTGKAEGPLPLEERDAFMADPHEWTETFQIKVQFPVSQEEIQESRQRREAGAASLEPVFRRWQQEGQRRFDDWYREELDAWSQFVWTDFLYSTGRLLAGLEGLLELEKEDVIPRTRSRELVFILAENFEKAGVPGEETLDRVRDFLFSGTLDRVPRLRISSLLWAGIAHQAARGGRRRPPGRGMMTDVAMVSSVLPYCDAILVDSELKSLLEFGPARARLEAESRVFSMGSMGDLRDYLDGLEEQASPDLVKTAVDLYGNPEPYVEIFEAGD